MKFSDLPELGQPLDGGTFAGITTRPDGSHCAVVLLPGVGTGLTWIKAKAWAESVGGELPARPAGALLFANVRTSWEPHWYWHWTCEEIDPSFAWSCDFGDGNQDGRPKNFEGSAVAVRLIPLGGGA